VGLRRYTFSNSSVGYHSAMVIIGRRFYPRNDEGYYERPMFVFPGHDDPRWPKACECGAHTFTDEDEWQEWSEACYQRGDTGDFVGLLRAPPGAMWDAWWLKDFGAPTSDGRHIEVVCPNGRTWSIDSRASNCTMKDDRVHHCWIRHGEPPNLTVDKNGLTCQAGAGSIQAGDYHGFLRDGVLTAG